MSEGKLTKWIKQGYPHLKNSIRLDPWILPEHGFDRIVDAVGESGILEVSRPMGLTENVERLLNVSPDSSVVLPQVWEDAVKKWLPLSHVKPIITAYLEVVEQVTASCYSNNYGIDTIAVCRHIAVLLLAPFVEQGKVLLEEIADILGKPATAPGELLKSYADAVCRMDIKTLDKINGCIVKYSKWQEWALKLQELVLKCPYTSKLVAVTPEPSTEVIGLLATLIKEAYHGPSGDSPECTGEQVTAQ